VHNLLDREMAEVRMFLDQIEKYAGSLTESDRRDAAVSAALESIARDSGARERFLTFARDADRPVTRARMIGLARTLGWLSQEEQQTELMRMIGEQLRRDSIGSADVDLACALNRDGELGRELKQLNVSSTPASKVSNAAVLACLGSAEGHAKVLHALASTSDDDVQIAQVYLHHRPIADAGELRTLTASVAHMRGSDAQVRALNTLASYRLSDRESLAELVQLFPQTKSVNVQRAIAGVLIRSDFDALEKPDVLRALRQNRVRSPDGADVIDALIRRLENVMLTTTSRVGG
jgi:hypothetical protein